jgi:hypothetical protein
LVNDGPLEDALAAHRLRAAERNWTRGKGGEHLWIVDATKAQLVQVYGA